MLGRFTDQLDSFCWENTPFYLHVQSASKDNGATVRPSPVPGFMTELFQHLGGSLGAEEWSRISYRVDVEVDPC